MGNSAPASPTFYDAVTRLQELARAVDDATIYNIVLRYAGWAIQWYERALDPYPNDPLQRTYEQGLVTYRYYDTLQAAIEGETARLEARQAERMAVAGGRNGN